MRHSWSNHFFLDVFLIRLRDLLILILRQFFDVAVKMFTASSNEMASFRFLEPYVSPEYMFVVFKNVLLV